MVRLYKIQHGDIIPSGSRHSYGTYLLLTRLLERSATTSVATGSSQEGQKDHRPTGTMSQNHRRIRRASWKERFQ